MNLFTRMWDALVSWLLLIGIVAMFAVLAHRCAARADDAERIPDEAVAPIFEVVAAILTEHGQPVKPQGVPVYFKRLNGIDGMTVGGVIVINSERPLACFKAILGHEAVHALLWRDMGKTPAESEPMARAMERLVSDEFVPNCETRS